MNPIDAPRSAGRWLPRAFGLVVAAAALGLGACTDGGDRLFVPGNGPDAPVDSIAVSPATARLVEVGQTQPFTATAFAATGQVLDVDFTWSSQDLAVATVNQEGVATAQGPGQTDVVASVGDDTGSAVLSVELTITP